MSILYRLTPHPVTGEAPEEGDYVWIKQFVGNQNWILGKFMQELSSTMFIVRDEQDECVDVV